MSVLRFDIAWGGLTVLACHYFPPLASAVSISVAKKWEKQLMEDPKVCGLAPWLLYYSIERLLI